MSWLQSTRAPLSRGTKLLLQGSSTGAAWRLSAPMAARTGRTTQPSICTSRLYTSQRFMKANNQTPRFKRSGVSPATEIPAGAVGESTSGEAGLNKTNASDPTTATSPATTQTPVSSTRPPRPQAPVQGGSQTAPPVRKPVDTSTKEYKQAASRYIRFVVGLPVLLVTSYFLWQRREYFLQPGT